VKHPGGSRVLTISLRMKTQHLTGVSQTVEVELCKVSRSIFPQDLTGSETRSRYELASASVRQQMWMEISRVGELSVE